MRADLDHDRAVRDAAQGDPAALAALFDVHGAGVYAFCHRLLGAAEPAADATQDAFLAATEAAAEPGYEPAGFYETLLSTARVASLELLGSRGGAGRAGGTLSAATMRLRPQQRAALSLVGLAGLSYAQTARILQVHPGAVAPLLARARLRLRDEMQGTAMAAAAVRSPDCEEALPLLAADADGELDATEAGWLRAHVADCDSCPRTRAAMGEAAATYAAWSPAAPPSWLQASTLAEFESDHAVVTGAVAATPAAAAAGPRRARGGAVAPARRPGLATAALGGALVIAAFALLVAVLAGPLRDSTPNGSVGSPGASQTIEVAGTPLAVPDAGASARAEREAAAARARRAAADRARAARAARARARDARVRAANARSARRRVSTRRTTTRRSTSTTAPPRTTVTPRRRTSTTVGRPARRTTSARRPRRSTTTSTPAPAATPAPSSSTADEPAATASTPAPAAPAAPASGSRPTQSTAPLPAVSAPAAATGNGRGCGHGGCGAPPRCSPNGNCHKSKGRKNKD